MLARIALFLLLTALPARAADAPRVVADIAPVHSLVAQVMQGVGAPLLLLDGAGDPHHVQLRPSQMRALARADLVVWVGAALTPWLEGPLSGRPALELLGLPGVHLRGAADADHDHGHGGVDPHAWLDPEVARLWVAAIADRLSEIDPDRAASYRANAAAADARLVLLGQDIAARLAGTRDQGFLGDHETLGYFADRFGLNILGAVRDGDAAAPGAARVARMRALAESGAVDCGLGERGMDRALILTVLDGLPIPVAITDPTGAGLTPGPDHYAATLTRLAIDIAACAAGK